MAVLARDRRFRRFPWHVTSALFVGALVAPAVGVGCGNSQKNVSGTPAPKASTADNAGSSGSSAGATTSGSSDPALAARTADLTAKGSAIASASPSASVANPATSPEDATKLDTRPRVSTTRLLGWVHERPSGEAAKAGYLRAGGKAVRGESTVPGPGCAKGWWPIVSGGFVCEGQDGITTNMDDPTVVVASKYQPKKAPLPYGYGTSFGSSMYARVPTKAEQKKVEGDIEMHRASIEKAMARLPKEKVPPKSALSIDPMPDFLKDHAQIPPVIAGLPPHSLTQGFAWTNMRATFLASFEVDERLFYLTSDHAIVPAERFRAHKLAEFEGVDLTSPDSGEHLPMLWVRWKPARLHKLVSGSVVSTEEMLPFQAHASIEPKEVILKGTRYFQLSTAPKHLAAANPGVTWLVRSPEVTRVDAETDLPFNVGATETWMSVSIGRQSLVVYQGLKPIFVTLVSTGVDGVAEIETTRATPRGAFRIHSKHITHRMEAEEHAPWKPGDKPDPRYRIDDVPWVQYFHNGYALHAAFWHDAFGQPKSHGCINLSPKDAMRLFGMTMPAMPDGWHGVYGGRAGAALGSYLMVRAY